MTSQDTHIKMQAVRRINENPYSTPGAAAAAPSDIIHIACYPDPSTGKDIIIWNDGMTLSMRSELQLSMSGLVPFLAPLRLAAVPGATLDVVIRSQLSEQDLSLRSLQNALPATPQESSSAKKAPPAASVTVTTAAAESNPVGAHAEATKKKDADINNSAAVIETPPPPPYGGPVQAAQGNQTSPPTTAIESEPPSDSQSASQPPEEDAPPEKDAPQEPEAPHERTLTVAQKFEEAQLKAMLGDMNAQFALGNMYKYGQGTVQSDSQVVDWYLKAAKQRHVVAQYSVGKSYQTGQGAKSSYEDALTWYVEAASQGHGGWESRREAIEWYRKAVTQGHAAAQYSLGKMYYEASQGHVLAINFVDNMYCIGHGVAQDYFKAAVWYLKAAGKGDMDAQNSLAVLYETGLGVPENRAKAIKWYQKAVHGGSEVAQKALDRLKA
ncbi:hypothetical protein BGW39_006345 [Mortierella sp. 14UC]|nr:hypothetical protein BGW39_006345 [Mortierella sp. 14UC]